MWDCHSSCSHNTHEPVCALPCKPFYDRLAQARGLRPLCLFAHSVVSSLSHDEKGNSLRLSVLSPSCWRVVSIDPERITVLWVRFYCLLYSLHVQFTKKEQISNRKELAELVVVQREDHVPLSKGLEAYKISLSKCCSKFKNTDDVWLWGRFWWLPNVLNREYEWKSRAQSMVGAYGAESTGQWTAASVLTTKIPRFKWLISLFFFNEELIDEWLDLTVLGARNEDQHWRTVLSEMSSISGIRWDPMSSKKLRVFPKEFWSIFPSKKRNHWGGQVDRQALNVPVASKRCLEGHATDVRYEPRTRGEDALNHDVQATRDHWHATQIANHERSFLFCVNLTKLMFIVVGDPTERLANTLSHRRMSLLILLKALKRMFMDLFCTPKSSIENPELRGKRTRRQ